MQQLGEAMRQARRESGMVWAAFAQQAAFGEAYLRNVENGNRPVTAAVAAAYDRVLGTAGAFEAALRGSGAIDSDAAPWSTSVNLTVLTGLLNGSRVDRRGFLAVGAALSASAAAWSAVVGDDQLGQVSHADDPAGPALLGHVEDRLDHLRRLDDELGSGEVHGLARGELSLLVRLIQSGRHKGPSMRRLYTMASEAARQAAWSAFDQGNLGVAQRYFDAALRASADADDPIGGAYALSFAAIQCYSTPGEAGRAVALLDAASSHVRGQATPRMHGMLAARTARALSKTGAKKDCARQLDFARAALDKGTHDDDPKTLYWVDHGEIEMIAGSCALELGDAAEAVRRFTAAQAVARPGEQAYPRSHAIYLARAAEAHFAMHDLDAALELAHRAAHCLGTVDSARSASELSGLRKKLAPHSAHSGVRDFLEVG
ncbi:helix-turn-helix domain-containing protein [Yinghuangia soli]|uniref:Helix-turn-helix domain-containing protein n=1 Tax=Yinghuangia soli TaxID=2908204 RepID=A0AA41PW88_9ACTN|nr:helix-turn-helix domain-containing protein [Yinghuangia soli]MCF2526341.1 helix-turn-helix domain-containing protein [Yinghuangia soli]